MKKSANRIIAMVVTNDLEGDQRLHKMAVSLQKNQWKPFLLGRKLPDSKPLVRSYPVKRIRMIFRKGPLFYFFFNVRMFLGLLFTRAGLFVSNDLDTLPAVFCASALRGIPMVYDSHEYFTEVPELVNRKRIKGIWKYLERKIQPRLSYVITVNESIAELFRDEYGQQPFVIKNQPAKSIVDYTGGELPERLSIRPVILYQGAVNIGRGLEELLDSMPLLSEFNLLIAGGGDILDNLKERAKKLGVAERVYFTGRVPFETLRSYTAKAQIGVSLEQDLGLNYRLSLPNKLFDYLQAGLPVVASDLPEISRLVREVDFGTLVSDFSPVSLSRAIRDLWSNKELYEHYSKNALSKACFYTWESQEEALYRIYDEAAGGL